MVDGGGFYAKWPQSGPRDISTGIFQVALLVQLADPLDFRGVQESASSIEGH